MPLDAAMKDTTIAEPVLPDGTLAPPISVKVTGPAVKAGDSTSEFGLTKNSNRWATVLQVLGVIATMTASLTDMLNALPASSGQLKLITILGIVGVMAGQLSKAITTAAYTQGRSLVKAAAARDVAPPPQV